MSIIVYFDTNIYELIVDSEKRSQKHYQNRQIVSEKLMSYIENGKIIPVLSEAIFIDELFQKRDRGYIASNYKPDVSVSWHVSKTDSRFITMNMSIGPDPKLQPNFQKNSQAQKYFTQAINLGFKILRCPGFIAGRSNLDLKPHFLMDNTHRSLEQEQNKMHSALALKRRV